MLEGSLTLRLALDNALYAITLADIFPEKRVSGSILQGQGCLKTWLNDPHWGTYDGIDWGWTLLTPYLKVRSRSCQGHFKVKSAQNTLFCRFLQFQMHPSDRKVTDRAKNSSLSWQDNPRTHLEWIQGGTVGCGVTPPGVNQLITLSKWSIKLTAKQAKWSTLRHGIELLLQEDDPNIGAMFDMG